MRNEDGSSTKPSRGGPGARGGSGAASRRADHREQRGHQDGNGALSQETVAEAAMELLRMALEYELISGPNGMAVQEERDAQRTVWYTVGTREVLRRLVNEILQYRDKRWDLVRQIRAAQVALNIREFIKDKEQGSATFKDELAKYIEQQFELAGLPIDDAQRHALVEAAITKLRGTEGRLEHILAAMVKVKVTSARVRTMQGHVSALKGREQAQGTVRLPKEAGLVYGYDPRSPFHLLDYAVRHMDQGFSGVTEMFMHWDEKDRRAMVAKWLRELADRLVEPQAEPTDL
ncbi:hypothetical protein [Sorangium sp. So ce128]|uniref:hypothetical protein n=1 Tax=Sorangium sp. So ce128 TaxID=3133281 RepID=UPI003F5E4362